MLTSLTHSLAQTFGLFALIPALIFGLIGIQMLRVALMQMVAGHNMSRLRPIPGRIDSSHVEVKEVHSEHGTSEEYKPVITYTYVVDGKEYHGERINLNLPMYTQAGAKALVALYPANSNTTIFYSPELPDWSLLQTKIKGRGLEVLIGLVTLAVAVYCVYLATLNPHMAGLF